MKKSIFLSIIISLFSLSIFAQQAKVAATTFTKNELLDCKDIKTLLTKIDDGYHIAVGSRYIPGADIKRSPKREFLSRIYNILLKLFFNVKFRDAQCGFKAYHGEAVADIIPRVEDTGWFWDTESMILAQRKGYKIAEIPVKWQEVRDEIRRSKVSPFIEVVRQLINIYLLRKRS